jgi:hypothetical protein
MLLALFFCVSEISYWLRKSMGFSSRKEKWKSLHYSKLLTLLLRNLSFEMF